MSKRGDWKQWRKGKFNKKDYAWRRPTYRSVLETKPATDKQKQYLTRLGVEYPSKCSRKDASILINKALAEKANVAVEINHVAMQTTPSDFGWDTWPSK